MSQYVYFGFRSECLPASAMTARLGVEPDAFGVRGSKRPDPVRPHFHSWEVRCDRNGMTVDDQIMEVVERLAPYADRISELVTELDSTDTGDASLMVVRYFDSDDGEEENDRLSYHDGREMIRLPGQHQLLGWSLEPRALEFLVRTGAMFQVDEYG